MNLKVVTGGADVGLDALHRAVESRNLVLLTELVENGASPNSVSRVTGLTALQLAAIHNYDDVAETLLSLGADGDLTGLVQRKGEVNISHPALVLAVERGHLEMVTLLLNTGLCDVNIQTRRPHTALIAAVERGFTEITKMLIRAHADVNKVDQRFRSALYFAVLRQQSDVVHCLIEAGARLDQVDSKGETVCHVAARKGHKDILRILLEAGGDPNTENILRDSETPLYNALISSFPDITRLLLQYGADPNPGLSAVFLSNHCDFNILRMLLEYGVDVNFDQNHSRYPLVCLAVNKEWYDAAKFLIMADYKLGEVTLEAIEDLDLLNTNNAQVEEFVQWVSDFNKERLTLKRLCRTFVRLHLQVTGQSGLTLPNKIFDLPLPLMVKRYLCYLDI